MRDTFLWRLRPKECAWVDCDTKYEWISNMNLLKKLWNWLVGKTSTSPTLVVVEEEGCCREIFLHILQEAGVSKHVKKVNGLELFDELYDGPCNEESIQAALPDFKTSHPAVAAKMTAKL